MSEDRSEAKRRISRRFLGKAGIHGVGLHPSCDKTIIVYRTKSEEYSLEELCRDLETEASPFQVELIEDEAPSITEPPSSQDASPDEEE